MLNFFINPRFIQILIDFVMKNLCISFSLLAFFHCFSFHAALAQEDTIPPVVTIIGPIPQIVPCNGSYIEFGAEAMDNIDGVLDVTIGGDCVCLSQAGSYVVTYTATDSSGNSTTESRLVIVQGDCSGDCFSDPPCNEEYGPPMYIAKDDFVETPINTSIEIPVLDNEFTYHLNGAILKVSTLLTLPNYGTASIIDAQTIRYEPNENFIGKDSFLYQATTGSELLTDSATVFIEVGTTSLQNSLTYPSLQVYPNPAKDVLHIELGSDLAAKQDLQLLLFNTFGQLQLKHPISNVGTSTIDLEGLQQGLYLFQLKEKDGEVLANGKVLLEW